MLIELGLLPFTGFHDLLEMFYRIPNVFKPNVERGEAEAQDVFVLAAITGTVVPNDAACDQGLNDGIRAGVQREADL